MVGELVKQLADELKIKPDLDPEKEGHYVIQVAEELGVTIAPMENQGYYFRSYLGDCGEKKQEEFFQELMLANLFGQGTGDAVLSLDQEGKGVYLTLARSKPQNYQAFRDEFEDFLNYVDMWYEEVTNHRKESAKSANI